MLSIKLDSIHTRMLNLLQQNGVSYLFFFLVGLALRGIPELLVSWYPVGYETITWYAPPLMTFLGRSVADVFVEFFWSGPLFYLLMWLVSNTTGAHPFVILKVTGPLLYAILSVSFFMFLRRGLKFEWKMAFLATLLLIFQIAALRESWDRFRTVLGLFFLFATLTTFKSSLKYKWWLVTLLALLTVFSREYVAVVLFVAVLGFAFLEKKDRQMSLIALSPALFISVVTVNPSRFGFAQNFLPFGQNASLSYSWVVQDAFVIFLVCYFILLPFVVAGWNKDKLVGSMAVWLLLGSFSVVSPWLVVPGYQRWLMLLVFPFSVYAVKGFERLQLFNKRRIWMLTVLLSVLVLIGVGYSTGAFSYVGQMPNSYVAVNLLQSSISWSQVEDAKAVFSWLNENAESNSSLISEERFYGWALIYLERANEDVNVFPYSTNSSFTPALELALIKGLTPIYLIWYTHQSLNNFKLIHSQNVISIFQYEPEAQF